MSEASPAGKIPPVALAAAAAIMALTIGAALVGRLSGIGAMQGPNAAAVQLRSLVFADRADGAIVITQGGDGALVEVLPPGGNGFIRGVLRSLARDRRAHGVGPEPAFDLVRRANGQIALLDPATSGRIELDAFGSDNVEAFAHLLKTDAARLQEVRP